jgi:L,D-transpeptidase ErfK/SrfK
MSKFSSLNTVRIATVRNRQRQLKLVKWLAFSIGMMLFLAILGFGAWFLLHGDVAEAESLPESAEINLGKDTYTLDGLSAKEKQRLARRLQLRNQAIQQEMKKWIPQEDYIIIDTAHNRLYLKNGEEILREAVCSTGSGRVLADPRKKRQWIFDTPRGEFQVQGKVKNPVWRKPDWAFIEEGESVPKSETDRFESGTLGDYGLAFGNGFFIHGTLYTRLLGRSVTHGCVRLGDEDLKYLFQKTNIGTRIFIY